MKFEQVLTTNPTAEMLIPVTQLASMIHVSRSSLYDWMNPKSSRYDPTFPAPIKVGRATRWLLSEINNWIEAKAKARNNIQLSTLTPQN
ncbi:AlpA family transcriptional regulator [Acinetobacter sp. YH12151]|uniref:helix-turn-helix transcriptional regulator n=1 Tax=Acinetobacter sp. YH12151 TaxID=2601131 RepID=UPI00211F3960|nr:AlpA family phage regulatory protein [Acinetobacter sp. YH12151]